MMSLTLWKVTLCIEFPLSLSLSLHIPEMNIQQMSVYRDVKFFHHIFSIPRQVDGKQHQEERSSSKKKRMRKERNDGYSSEEKEEKETSCFLPFFLLYDYRISPSKSRERENSLSNSSLFLPLSFSLIKKNFSLRFRNDWLLDSFTWIHHRLSLSLSFFLTLPLCTNLNPVQKPNHNLDTLTIRKGHTRGEGKGLLDSLFKWRRPPLPHTLEVTSILSSLLFIHSKKCRNSKIDSFIHSLPCR